jgi:hypothetical protein
MRDIDEIVRRITDLHPSVKARQLRVSHPGHDDDGVWFFEQPGCSFEVQAESSNGTCPFLVETDESDIRCTTQSVRETIETIIRLLHLSA